MISGLYLSCQHLLRSLSRSSVNYFWHSWNLILMTTSLEAVKADLLLMLLSLCYIAGCLAWMLEVQSVLYLSIFVKHLTWSTTTYFSINSRSTTKLPSLFLMMPSLTPYDLPFPPTYANGHISATGDPIHFMFWDGGSKGAIYGSNKSKMVATAMLEKFQVAISPQPVVRSTW